ncbi:hypothetical protein EDB81DRAFT_894143 [Dactylonectria macrodidyma]|uniref:Uncharacterized protein n=1 Tax=Dactylonectria macrodidyma TaxID=307937 RepID=A0A9P9IA15_9HYPO|nr:hypothetical protein EDB81DRAFT_894143 [Dactylonectria macrodidyma]
MKSEKLRDGVIGMEIRNQLENSVTDDTGSWLIFGKIVILALLDSPVPQKPSSHIERMMPEFLTPTDDVTPQKSGQPVKDQFVNTASDQTLDGDILEYPEGGTKARLVVIGAWCPMIPSMGLLNSLAVLQAWLTS